MSFSIYYTTRFPYPNGNLPGNGDWGDAGLGDTQLAVVSQTVTSPTSGGIASASAKNDAALALIDFTKPWQIDIYFNKARSVNDTGQGFIVGDLSGGVNLQLAGMVRDYQGNTETVGYNVTDSVGTNQTFGGSGTNLWPELVDTGKFTIEYDGAGNLTCYFNNGLPHTFTGFVTSGLSNKDLILNLSNNIDTCDIFWTQITFSIPAITVTATRSGDDVAIAWGAVVGADHYKMSVNGGAFGANVTSPQTDAGAAFENNTYTVRAYDAGNLVIAQGSATFSLYINSGSNGNALLVMDVI